MKATLSFLLFSAAVSNADPIPLSGPSNVGWRSLGANFDFTNDQQTGDPASDIVGSADNPGFFTTFDDNSTTSLTDGYLGFRVRLDDQSNTVDFGRNLWIGVDADLSGSVDAFLGLNMQGGTSSAEIGIFSPGSGLNTSPNTTTVESTSYTDPNVAPSAANYNYRAVNFTTDGGTSNDIGTDNKADTDFYLSFLVPFADLVSFLGNKTPNPISINQNTSLRYVLGTSTQPNSFNQDLGGIDNSKKANVDLDQTWAVLGGFTPTTTPSGVPECSASLLAFIGSMLTFGFRRRR